MGQNKTDDIVKAPSNSPTGKHFFAAAHFPSLFAQFSQVTK